MIRRHLVVVKRADGSPDVHPMKEWLRLNPQDLPKDMDASDNSSAQLRRALKKSGWELEELNDRVFLIKPDENGDISYADALIAAGDENEEDVEEEVIEAEEITFGLERDLQVALRANIEQLESGLRIIDGGKERVTEEGRIDITAEDKRGNIVVIELKAGGAKPAIVAQVLSYVSEVAESDKKPVRGILVAGGFHKRVILAARAVPNLQLKKYSFLFAFEPVS
ncbi:MAG: DUF91 domain-containing protein [Chloroflexi bacterium]|nr:DUF91 domain-containing protein [Chloroflexota bacterium]